VSVELPTTRYARSGDVSIAYQVFGNGAIDLVVVPGTLSHLELAWEDPAWVHFYERFASFARVIVFDKRGMGLSERVALATPEERMDDIRAVMDAAASERAAVFGISEGGAIAALFAAAHPARTTALVMYGAFAKWLASEDYPWAPTAEDYEEAFRSLPDQWGQPLELDTLAPSIADDERAQAWWAKFHRLSTTPNGLATQYRMNMELDIRQLLSAIRVPTLILHRTNERQIPVEGSRYMAERIPGSKLVELEGIDHPPWIGDGDSVVEEIEEFLTGARHAPEPTRVLATILFTDIVGSTEKAAELGDRAWRELRDQHHAVVRRMLEHYRGHEVDTAGDGFFASFDGPARAINSACEISDAMRELGLQVRAGLHTGECELIDGKIGGIAVHIGARVAAAAGPGEVLVSGTVKDLVAGSNLAFRDLGIVGLKGVPGEWHLYSVRR
jgi:class 3 adenylate cyclase/pimeloyl-ACP methyl ester carboxylesterase